MFRVVKRDHDYQLQRRAEGSVDWTRGPVSVRPASAEEYAMWAFMERAFAVIASLSMRLSAWVENRRDTKQKLNEATTALDIAQQKYAILMKQYAEAVEAKDA